MTQVKKPAKSEKVQQGYPKVTHHQKYIFSKNVSKTFYMTYHWIMIGRNLEQRRYILSKIVLVVCPQSSYQSEDLVLEPKFKRYTKILVGCWSLVLGPTKFG